MGRDFAKWSKLRLAVRISLIKTEAAWNNNVMTTTTGDAQSIKMDVNVRLGILVIFLLWWWRFRNAIRKISCTKMPWHWIIAVSVSNDTTSNEPVPIEAILCPQSAMLLRQKRIYRATFCRSCGDVVHQSAACIMLELYEVVCRGFLLTQPIGASLVSTIIAKNVYEW